MARELSSPSLAPSLPPRFHDKSVLGLSDDECFARLSHAIEEHDDSKLDQLALLIGRLAVPIE
jgi:hypothetical protein